MKNMLILVFALCLGLNSNAQAEFLPADPVVPTGNEIVADCSVCPSSISEYKTGVRTGLGFGLVFPITPKLDFTTTFSFQYWRNQIAEIDYINFLGYNRYYVTEYTNEDILVLNFSIGQRFHFAEFESSSLFLSTNLNAQGYLKNYQDNYHESMAISIEPGLGWKKNIGKKMEYFVVLGFDQLITSYDDVISRKPSSAALNMGFSLRLVEKEKALSTLSID